MLKKFVTLNSNVSPSVNPYEIRTYIGDTTNGPEWQSEFCRTERNCNIPANSTISKVITIEDELRRLNQKAQKSKYQRQIKNKCDKPDDFTACTFTTRTPRDLRKHAILRERYLQTTYELSRHVHDASSRPSETPSLIQFNSPIQMSAEEEDEEEEGGEEETTKVFPQYATPECSMDLIYMPPEKLLQLKRPKSGMFHNETEPPFFNEEDLPYSFYNPRVLQQHFEEQNLPQIDIIEGRSPNDLWTWNIGLQKKESELDRAFIDATIPKLDCNKMELAIFKIPQDLDKTFTAEIVFGNTSVIPALPPRKPPFFNRPREVPCLFAAFVESYRVNPDFWTAQTMDNILSIADKLYKKSVTLNYKSDDTDYDIIPQIVERQAAIGLKVHFTGPLENEPNIYKTLSLYFSKYTAAILCSKNIFLLIWKRCQNSFYIFDPNGRNELCQRDFTYGKCSLLANRYVEHLVHLIVNFSEADMQEEFHLYEIFLTNYGKIMHPIPPKPFPKRTRKIWAVVNDTYALIPAANNGLQQPITGNEQNRSMLVALMALLYSNIENASYWRMEVLDGLVLLGQNHYKNYAKRLKIKKNEHLNINDLPEVIPMGAFIATLKKQSFLYTGHVADCGSFMASQLTIAVKELFANKWEAALLQIDNSVLALWRDIEYFYLFDPFRRGKAGQVLDPDDFLTKGVACLQLHTNFESFCRVLYQKALKMRRGGKFFIHGINIGCIKPAINLLNFKNKLESLRLSYPKYAEEEKVAMPEEEDKKGKGKKGKKVKPARTYSILSIPEEDRIPEFDDRDVVEGVLEDVLCEIFQSMVEPIAPRPHLYKQAEKVLLRSDKDYLETLRYKIKHGQDIDMNEAYQTYPDPPAKMPTIEEEMLVPSNFEILPDGAWVIFGTTQLPAIEDEMSKLSGLLSGLVTTALSAKYKISTWNSELIEYALEAANNFGEAYQNYQHTLSTVLYKKLPKISIGQNVFYLKIQKVIKSALTKSLRQVLLDSLIIYDRLLVICQRFSCVIIKRYNFLYMFIGFPCNTVGYRKFGSGPGCLLRFVELDSIIRRIEFGCNPQGCDITNYVAVAIKVVDVTNDPPQRFRNWPDYEERAIYATEYEKHQMQEQQKLDKIRFLDKELRKENERIQKFLAAKKQRAEERRMAAERRRNRGRCAKKITHSGMDYEDEGLEEEYYDYMEEEMMEEEDEIKLKHMPGKKLKSEILDQYKPRPILYGYHMREKDCMYKIQGSIAMQGREESSVAEIKPCFFVSTMAILYAILRPLNQWSSQRIDRVIESGTAIASKISNMATAFERIIKNIVVDDYKFDVKAQTYEPAGIWGIPLDKKIQLATQTRHYIMLQISNSTFAIYRDEYFHLFDPYASMELLQQDEEEEEDEDEGSREKGKCPRGLKRYAERNTASWILFADVDAMLKYINKRAVNADWQFSEEFIFHVVDIISYKKAGPRTRILQLLTDLSIPMTCRISKKGEDDSIICAHNETTSWLDLDNCLPVWSRMNRRNTAGKYRNLALSKLKKYDIEIEGRLWSLWGGLHPAAPVFSQESRGKQYLACNVIACCAASVYHLADWSSQLLDSVVISGDKYHRESLSNIKQLDYEFSLEDLNLECALESIKFVVHLEHVCFGRLYCIPTRSRMNLADALMYFFTHFRYGVLQCHNRSLAIGNTMGHDGGYFMFDCQSKDHPLFPRGQGASYVLRTKFLQVLLYCIVVTLNVPYYNVQFTIHKVEMLRDGASVDASTDANEEEEKE